MQPMLSLTMPLQPPVHLLKMDSMPKLVAGGVPVLPMNLIFTRKRQFQLAPDTTLASLAHAAQYYVEFCAHRRYGLLDVAHEEFTTFKNALLGEPFKDAEGNLVYLSGSRNRSLRRVDHILQLLYGIAADIAEVYGETFDWQRYKGSPSPHGKARRHMHAKQGSRRVHAVRWERTKITGLPDERFVKLLQAAKARWGEHISAGDKAYAADPEMQRGALFYRNVALLFVLRYAGSRRAETNQLRSGSALVTANMRHASIQSGDAYAAGTEVFVDDILSAGNARIIQLIKEASLGKDLLL
jgi:hypothetical protein